MIMVSFCWKMNVLPNKIKNDSVSSTMFMKLTIKVVAFFLGHPVYIHNVQFLHFDEKSYKLIVTIEIGIGMDFILPGY